jgi:hypothetical protein
LTEGGLGWLLPPTRSKLLIHVLFTLLLLARLASGWHSRFGYQPFFGYDD